MERARRPCLVPAVRFDARLYRDRFCLLERLVYFRPKGRLLILSGWAGCSALRFPKSLFSGRRSSLLKDKARTLSRKRKINRCFTSAFPMIAESIAAQSRVAHQAMRRVFLATGIIRRQARRNLVLSMDRALVSRNHQVEACRLSRSWKGRRSGSLRSSRNADRRLANQPPGRASFPPTLRAQLHHLLSRQLEARSASDRRGDRSKQKTRPPSLAEHSHAQADCHHRQRFPIALRPRCQVLSDLNGSRSFRICRQRALGDTRCERSFASVPL